MVFQLGATQDRMGRSFAAAAVSHVVGVGLILLLISLSPERVYDIVEPNREHYGLVWLPAEFEWTNGGKAVGLLPTRYPGSERSVDPTIQLARRTEWEDQGNEIYFGLGQRILATDV